MSEAHHVRKSRGATSAKRLWAALVATSALAAPPAHAQSADADITCDLTGDFPCTFGARELALQKVPSVLKFQARVSQAKLPRGDGAFGTLFVKLLRGTEALCVEQFKNIRIVDGWINLEIGREMNCELDEVIAENDGLSFQVCPGGAENCLRATALGASPYAIKSSFASIAYEAHHANLVGQAHYAHRATADDNMLARGELGIGYFDFFSPTAEKATALHPTVSDFAPYLNSGFISWTPSRDEEALRVHIAGRRIGSNDLAELRSLHLVSDRTVASGDVTVAPSVDGAGLTVKAQGLHVTGNSDIDGTLGLTRDLAVTSGGADVTGDSQVTGELGVTRRTTVHSGGMDITGDSDNYGELTVSQMMAVLSGGVSVKGASTIGGTLLIHGTTTVSGGGLAVTGDSQIGGRLSADGHTTIGDGLFISTGGARVSAGGVEVTAGGVNITGAGRFVGRVDATDLELRGPIYALDAVNRRHRFLALDGTQMKLNPDQSLDATVMKGPVRFTGTVTFEAGTVDPDQVENFLLARGEIRDIELGGALTIADAAQFTAGVAGGLSVAGGATLRGGLAVPGGMVGGLDIGGSLVISGASSFDQAVTFSQGISGALGVNGPMSTATLDISGASTLTGPVTFAGGVSGAVTFGGRLTTPEAATLSVLGASTLASLTVNQPITANGATTLAGKATFAGGVTGNATFGSTLSVTGATVLTGATSLASDLTVDGPTRFNGSVSFGGAFTGTTAFENIGISKNLTIGGTSTFNGPVSFPGGISGNVNVSSASVANGLTTSGWSVFNGAVTFSGQVSGLDDLPDYVKFTGEDRGITLQSVNVSGDATVQGSLTLLGGLNALNVTNLRVLTDFQAERATTAKSMRVGGPLIVTGTFSAPKCRICFNYSDSLGDDSADHKHACVNLVDGADSGMMELSGDVNGDDVFGIAYVCDDGDSENGDGWVY